MHSTDFKDFSQALDDAYELTGTGVTRVISAGAKAMFFAALAQHSLDTVRGALMAHCLDPARGGFPPKPADVIRQIQGAAGNDGRPDCDEAWAVAITSQDEADTVVWTAETAEAFGICRPVLDLGDEVGARMAFKQAYSRLVQTARAAGRPAAWSASMGWDAAKRDVVLTRAAVAGLLPAPTVALLAGPAGGAAPVTADGRAQLAKIRAMMAAGAAEKAAQRAAALEQDWREGEAWKRATAAQVAQHEVAQ